MTTSILKRTLGCIIISFIIFIASFKVPDLLKNRHTGANTTPDDKPPTSSEAEIDEKKWHAIWLKAIPGTDLDKLATQKLTGVGFFDRKKKEKVIAHGEAWELAKKSTTVLQWRDIWFKSIHGSDLEKLAKKKLTEMGYFKQKEAEKMVAHQEAELAARTAQTEKDWQFVWHRSIFGSDLEKLSKSKLNQFAYFKKSKLQKEIDHKNAEIEALKITNS